MSDQLVDGEGRVYEQNLLGEWRQKQGVFGPVKDVNWLGQPNVERNILGQPKVARNFWGQPIQASGGDGIGGEAALILFVILLPLAALALGVWLVAAVLHALWQVLIAFVEGWRAAVRSHPRAMLVTHLALGMGAVYGGLTVAAFPSLVCIGGVLLVPALWCWLWLTRRLPLIFMPINAVLAGGTLWWGSTLTREVWQPEWARLTTGLPALGNLPAVLAALPLLAWCWSQGMQRWLRPFVPLNLLIAGMVLWFTLLRVWPAWQPSWAAFVTPLPLIPPTGAVLLLGPLGLWLWVHGQARWPMPFVAANLLVFGGLLGLSGYHTRPAWDAAWRYAADGLPFAGVPILALTVSPISVWGWGRASRWRPTWFLFPNLLLSGGILWLLVDRARPLWHDAWVRAWGELPLRTEPALLAFVLPLAVWGWLHGSRRWPRYWDGSRALLLGLIAWLVIERIRLLWQPAWHDFAGPRAFDPALLAAFLPPTLWGWWRLRGHWAPGARVIAWVAATLTLGWLVSRLLPESTFIFRFAVSLLPLATWSWGLLLRRRPRLGWSLTVLPWVVIGALVVLTPAQARELTAALVTWVTNQGKPISIG